MAKNISEFVVTIEESAIQDLRQRLSSTRWPERETVPDWSQGIPLAYTRELADYWASTYDMHRVEKLLNQWPQHTATINDIDIHFIHRCSPNSDALPLIISHGWPGSVLEFHKVIDALADPVAHGGKAEDAFHIVAPSLPGFGFSGKPTATGTSAKAIGQMWGQLMHNLGYERYVAQGGDWGSVITQSMGQTELNHCAGIHVTMPTVAPDPHTMETLTEQEQSALAALDFYSKWDSGYSKQQATRPQTVAYGLADSPVGQMAWIAEKFYFWTDCERDGVKHPENSLSRDEILDNVMMYWLSNSAASSARLYWESFNKPNLDPIDMPVGCSIFPREIFRCSRRWAQRRYSQLIHWQEFDRGGHFASLEHPAIYISELRSCFRALR